MNPIRITEEDINNLSKEQATNLLNVVFKRACESAERNYVASDNFTTMNTEAGSYVLSETLKNLIQNYVREHLQNSESNGYYDNGEQIRMSRMEDESWYPYYQSFLEAVHNFLPNLDEVYNAGLVDSFDSNDERKAQILRWSVLYCERRRRYQDEIANQVKNKSK